MAGNSPGSGASVVVCRRALYLCIMCTHIMYVRKSIVRVYYVRAHHVCVQEQLVASAHHTNTPIVQALHMARAHTYTPINKCRHYTIHPADA